MLAWNGRNPSGIVKVQIEGISGATTPPPFNRTLANRLNPHVSTDNHDVRQPWVSLSPRNSVVASRGESAPRTLDDDPGRPVAGIDALRQIRALYQLRQEAPDERITSPCVHVGVFCVLKGGDCKLQMNNKKAVFNKCKLEGADQCCARKKEKKINLCRFSPSRVIV